MQGHTCVGHSSTHACNASILALHVPSCVCLAGHLHCPRLRFSWLRPLHAYSWHPSIHCTHTLPPMHTSALTSHPDLSEHLSVIRRNHRRPCVGSRFLWRSGQVSRRQEMLPSPTGSPSSQNDPPSHFLQAQPARTRCLPARCPGLLGCRQSPRRRLAHLDSAAAAALVPQPPSLWPVLSCLSFLTCWAAVTCYPSVSKVGRRLLSGLPVEGLTRLSLTSGRSLSHKLSLPIREMGRRTN